MLQFSKQNEVRKKDIPPVMQFLGLSTCIFQNMFNCNQVSKNKVNQALQHYNFSV